MSIIQVISIILTATGALFFVVGTIGLLRFPDVYTRLHALTKADNVGLGMVMAGLALQAESASILLKLLFIWLFIVSSSATTCFLVARAAKSMGVQPWKRQ